MSSLSVARVFLWKRMKTSGWTEAASFHGGITMSLLFCTPKMFVVQCDHMVRKGSLGNSPTISKERFLSFHLQFLDFSPNLWIIGLQNKTSLPPPSPMLLVINYLGIIKLREKARVSWVRCSLVTALRAARCYLLFREPCWCAWHWVQQGQKTRSSCSLRSVGLSLGLVTRAQPAHCVWVHRLRPTYWSTKCECESEALGNFWANSHDLALLL